MHRKDENKLLLAKLAIKSGLVFALKAEFCSFYQKIRALPQHSHSGMAKQEISAVKEQIR